MCAYVCIDMHVVYVFTQTGVRSAPSGLTVTLIWHGSTQPQTRSHMMIVRVGRDPHCAYVYSCSVSDLCVGGTCRSRQRYNYPDQTRHNNGNINCTNDHRRNEANNRLVTNDYCSFRLMSTVSGTLCARALPTQATYYRREPVPYENAGLAVWLPAAPNPRALVLQYSCLPHRIRHTHCSGRFICTLPTLQVSHG